MWGRRAYRCSLSADVLAFHRIPRNSKLHRTFQDIFVIIKESYELSQQILIESTFWLWSFSVEILGLYSASAMLESIRDSGDLF